MHKSRLPHPPSPLALVSSYLFPLPPPLRAPRAPLCTDGRCEEIKGSSANTAGAPGSCFLEGGDHQSFFYAPLGWEERKRSMQLHNCPGFRFLEGIRAIAGYSLLAGSEVKESNANAAEAPGFRFF